MRKLSFDDDQNLSLDVLDDERWGENSRRGKENE